MNTNPINDFFTGVRDQVKKISWPSQSTTIKTTIIVIVATIITAAYIGVVDYGLAYLIKEFII